VECRRLKVWGWVVVEKWKRIGGWRLSGTLDIQKGESLAQEELLLVERHGSRLLERRVDLHAGLELRACWLEDGDWRFRIWFHDLFFSMNMCSRGLRNDTCGSIGWLEKEECSRHVIGMWRCLWHADIPSCYENPLVLEVDCALGLASASCHP